MEPPAAQVDGGVPVMGVFLIDNRPRRARAGGAARERSAEGGDGLISAVISG